MHQTTFATAYANALSCPLEYELKVEGETQILVHRYYEETLILSAEDATRYLAVRREHWLEEQQADDEQRAWENFMFYDDGEHAQPSTPAEPAQADDIPF